MKISATDKKTSQDEIGSTASGPSTSTILPSRKEMLDTWVFEGKTYHAPMYKLPAPLEAAFQPSKSHEETIPPYQYDRTKFQVFFEETESEGGKAEEAGVVGIAGADIAGVTAIGDNFRIELVNAKDGKFPVTKEEFLKAIHAAKLTLGSYTGRFDEPERK